MADEQFVNYTDYAGTITQAINDFDAIQGQLKDKGVVDKNGTALSADTTGVATKDYAGLIQDQLFRVKGKKAGDLTLLDKQIDYVGSLSLDNATITFADGAEGKRVLSVVARNNRAGYIDSTGNITIGAINAENLDVSGQLSEEGGINYTYDAANKAYKYELSGNNIIESISIKKGSGVIGGTITTASHTDAVNDIKLSTTTDNANINTEVSLTAPAEADAAKYVKIDLSAEAKGKETVSTTLTKTINAGYISDADVTWADGITNGALEKTFEEASIVTGSKSVYLPKGEISNIHAQEGAKVAFSGADQIIADSGADLAEENTFATITGSVGGLKITGDITKGWLAAGTSIAGTPITVESSAIKIKKGTISGGSTNVHLTATPENIELAKGPTDYKIALTKDVDATNADKTNVALSVTNGYLTSADVTGVSHTVSVEEKDLYIAGAQVKAKISAPTVAYDGTGKNIVETSAPAAENLKDYYTVIPHVTATIIDNGSTNGYFKNGATGAFTGTGLAGEAAGTAYIKKGSVKLTHGLSVSAGAENKFNLTPSAPTTGVEGTDYIKFSTSGSNTVTPGYITAADVTADKNKNYYMPKAVVKYTESAEGGHFLEVKTAGFLASGVITAVEGNIDKAAVVGTLSAADGILSTSLTPTTGYAISLSKNAAQTNAGYISGEDGTLTLDTTYYVAKGSVTYAPAVDSFIKGAITRVADSKTFNVALTARAATAAVTNTEGFVKEADIHITKLADKEGTISIEEATLGVSGSGKIGVSASSNVSTSPTATKYVLNPTFAGGNMTASVTKAGYVDEDSTVSGTVTIGAEDKTPIYLTVGETNTITPTIHAKALTEGEITANFDSTVSGAYTVTVNGTDSIIGNLTPGYYGEDEKAISANSKITGSLSVAHGSASITAASATFNLTGATGLTLVTAPAKPSEYYALTANGSNLTLEKTVTEGYIKDSDVDKSLSTVTGSTTKYIANYEYSADRASESTGVNTTADPVGVDKGTYYAPASVQNFGNNANIAVIHTEATYAEHNILVTLGANAIGANPKADLERLKKRLAGTLVKGAA